MFYCDLSLVLPFVLFDCRQTSHFASVRVNDNCWPVPGLEFAFISIVMKLTAVGGYFVLNAQHEVIDYDVTVCV